MGSSTHRDVCAIKSAIVSVPPCKGKGTEEEKEEFTLVCWLIGMGYNLIDGPSITNTQHQHTQNDTLACACTISTIACPTLPP